MKQLKEALAQEDTVLFVGSGISIWSGLPTWSGLIEELAQFVEGSGADAGLIRAEVSRGDLLQAASYGFDKLTKHQIGQFIRATCRYGTAKPHEIHRKIVSLGPRCFITTNYDNLIEQSLQKWQPDRFYPPAISNRHLTEMAGIVPARAIDFIFKPHGDAADSESIILTREQYRQLLPNGERQAALESVKTLLASRPVVYLGFGLRDPDFIFMRDLLANTYKGGTRDHYAIMADVTEAEIDYWRRNYGIHLVNYATAQRADKSRDHSALLSLLDLLLQEDRGATPHSKFYPESPEVLLSLARHAAALERTPKLLHEFPIRVRAETRRRDAFRHEPERFDNHVVESFLERGPKRAILTGLPGAGKTYSLRCAAAQLASRLHKACMAEISDASSLVIPVFADLKLYEGDLCRLVSQTLPSNLPLPDILRCFNVKVFLDSFNEMPREYWESAAYEPDFQKFIKQLGNASLIIGSRTTDGLLQFESPAFSLDKIDEGALTAELKRLGMCLEGRFSSEIFRLLQRPFYFQYVASGTVALSDEPHPRDFYKTLFNGVTGAFYKRFRIELNVEQVLSTVAYEALNRGEEAFPLSDLTSSFRARLETGSNVSVTAEDVANWLVSIAIIIPHTRKRAAFVHQSVTEYLAATKLAALYAASPRVLKEKLELRRWDQSLFLTLSLLPPNQADAFLQDVIKADFVLALNAAKYLESDRDQVISRLLDEIPLKYHESDWAIESAIEFGLPLNETHVASLWRIAQSGDCCGGAAASRLVTIKGNDAKDELLELLVKRRADFNLGRNGIGPALQAFATAEDVQKIAQWADLIEAELKPDSEEEEYHGFSNGAGSFLQNIDLSVIQSVFLPIDRGQSIPRVRASILRDIVQEHCSSEGLRLAGELLLRGDRDAAFALHMILDYGEEKELSGETLTNEHVERLMENITTGSGTWEIDALRSLCCLRPDLSAIVRHRAEAMKGVEMAALLYCLSPSDLLPVFNSLSELVQMEEVERSAAPVGLLSRIEFDWNGRAEMFVKLLRLRDKKLALALMGNSCPPPLKNLGTIDIGAVEWWLEWMLESSSSKDGYWFVMQLGGLLAGHVRAEVTDQLVDEFNNRQSRFRRILQNFVIPRISGITTDAFTEDTVSFLLADLKRNGSVWSCEAHLLVSTATECFVIERLVPLLRGAEPQFAENLKVVLRQVGARHGRRYAIE